MERVSGISVRCLVLAVALATVGCERTEQSTTHPDPAPASVAGPAIELAGLQRVALRVRRDPAQGRVWLLTGEEVRVYVSGQLLRAIRLPEWSIAGYLCPPDLVVDGAGAAYVSSNVEPKLLRIDGSSFSVEERTIVLEGRERWETGFGALGFAPDGTLVGINSSAGGLLWRIDFARGTARLTAPPREYPDVCEIGAPEFARSEKGE